MSLKLRLLASIAILLMLALLLGGAVLCWQARAAVQDELRTSFLGARQEVRATLAGDVQHTVTMREVIAGFNGERNVRAFLLNEQNAAIAASRTEPAAQDVPGWFTNLMAPPQLSARISIPLAGFPCVLLLTSDAGDEISEVWQLARDAFAAMALFSVAALSLVWLIAGRSLRFVRPFQEGLRTISDGNYDAQLVPDGPPEFAALAQGFNHMAARLSGYRKSNHRLQQQILELQEEERAEIARDLHDEVGPYLFAIQVDADAVAKSGDGQTRARAGAIRDAAQHIQRHVKFILRQLKPVSGLNFGLETAIDDLIAFWERRHPDILFERHIDSGIALDSRAQEAAYRIVQESISNAVRHGRPRTVRIALTDGNTSVTVCVEDDGDGFGDTARNGMGLNGMAERVQALNGQFQIEHPERGVRVRALLPHADTRELEKA